MFLINIRIKLHFFDAKETCSFYYIETMMKEERVFRSKKQLKLLMPFAINRSIALEPGKFFVDQKLLKKNNKFFIKNE